MEEKVLNNKKHGMLVLITCIALEIVGLGLTIYGGINVDNNPIFPIVLLVGIIVLCVSWIPLCGLRILKPQEALVLTLFGKYIGTLKGEGFYAVNPFCSAINPAADTKLSQSGDVKKTLSVNPFDSGESINFSFSNKKIIRICNLNSHNSSCITRKGNPLNISFIERSLILLLSVSFRIRFNSSFK